MNKQMAKNLNIIYVLKRYKKFKVDQKEELLLKLIQNTNSKIRLLTTKILGNIRDIKYLPTLHNIATFDSDSMVRCEAVSSIGKLAKSQNTKNTQIPNETLLKIKNILLSFLDNNNDPKIILQAIRGLLIFKNDETIKEKLITFKSHPNEIIQNFINNIFTKNKQTTKEGKYA